jgi:hypothetical protein
LISGPMAGNVHRENDPNITYSQRVLDIQRARVHGATSGSNVLQQ